MFPKLTGPPSVAVVLFSAFVVMVTRQRLNRYAMIGMRGSGTDRSRHHQRKRPGIVAWKFNVVMGPHPLMLRIAMSLTRCVHSRHLRDLRPTIARVIHEVTSFGVALYLFNAISGSPHKTYQTPCSRTIRYVRGSGLHGFFGIVTTLDPLFPSLGHSTVSGLSILIPSLPSCSRPLQHNKPLDLPHPSIHEDAGLIRYVYDARREETAGEPLGPGLRSHTPDSQCVARVFGRRLWGPSMPSHSHFSQ